jgi:hypothetical protein
VTQPQPWRVLLVVLVAALVTGGGSLLYANAAAEQAQHRLCGLIVAQDDVYRETPPTTPTGKRVAVEFAQLRRDFDCPMP